MYVEGERDNYDFGAQRLIFEILSRFVCTLFSPPPSRVLPPFPPPPILFSQPPVSPLFSLAWMNQQIFWDTIKCGGSSSCGYLFGPSVTALLPRLVIRKIETKQV